MPYVAPPVPSRPQHALSTPPLPVRHGEFCQVGSMRQVRDRQWPTSAEQVNFPNPRRLSAGLSTRSSKTPTWRPESPARAGSAVPTFETGDYLFASDLFGSVWFMLSLSRVSATPTSKLLRWYDKNRRVLLGGHCPGKSQTPIMYGCRRSCFNNDRCNGHGIFSKIHRNLADLARFGGGR